MTQEVKAVWHLGANPTTFDFATFLVVEKTKGATHVHFEYDGQIQRHKYSQSIAWKRFGNILVGLCDLSGTQFSVGKGAAPSRPSYDWGDVERIYKENGTVWKYPRIKWEQAPYVTITMRQSIRNVWRDSNQESWTKAAAALGEKYDVVMIHDCEVDPMSIATRMKLYSNAVMNFGINNGPLTLCHLSDAPYTVFMKMNKDLSDHMKKTGFPEGSQFSFRTDKQKLVWADDSADNVMKEVTTFLGG